MKLKLLSICNGVLLLAIVYLFYENCKLKNTVADMQTAALQSEIQNAEYQREVEHGWQEQANQAARAAQDAISDVERKFDNLLVQFDLNGVHADSAGGDIAALPAAAADSGRTCKPCECKCSGTDRAKLQRFYTKQLTIAKNCDVTAARYNALLAWVRGITDGGSAGD